MVRLVRRKTQKQTTYARRWHSLSSNDLVYNRQLNTAIVALALKIRILRRVKEPSDDTKNRIEYLLRTLKFLPAKYISINYKFIDDDKPLKVDLDEDDEYENGFDLDHFDESVCKSYHHHIKCSSQMIGIYVNNMTV